MTGLDAHLIVVRGSGFTLDVTLAIAPGETLVLLGPNGAGKSTIVDAVAGLVPLDGGHIKLGTEMLDDPSRDIFVPPERRRVGVVFQDYLLFEHLNVRDNIAFGPRSRGTGRDRSRGVADRWIEALDLAALATRRPSELSGGQAQRVALARTLANEPEILLLDEALAALDVGSRSRLRRTLGEHLANFPGPRLLISHDPTDAFLLADRIAVIEAGRLSQTGTANEIRRHPATPYVADVAGTNLLRGVSRSGLLELDEHAHALQAANTAHEGPVLITIHPTAIALHREQPHGSPRNSWQTSIATVEPLGDTTRITLAGPLPLGVDITPASTAALGLVPGSRIWASVKATEIGVTQAGP